MNEILYQIVAVDSDLIKNYPTKVVCISQNENMDNGVIYNDYDFKNHRYIKTYVSDNFNVFDKHKEQEEKIYNLQSKIGKAIEYIEKYLKEHIIEDQPDEQSIFYDEKGCYIPNAKEQLLNILKEDK